MLHTTTWRSNNPARSRPRCQRHHKTHHGHKDKQSSRFQPSSAQAADTRTLTLQAWRSETWRHCTSSTSTADTAHQHDCLLRPCSVVKLTAPCSVVKCDTRTLCDILQHTPIRCNMQQYAATRNNTLQHTFTYRAMKYSRVMQHTAIHERQLPFPDTTPSKPTLPGVQTCVETRRH